MKFKIIYLILFLILLFYLINDLQIYFSIVFFILIISLLFILQKKLDENEKKLKIQNDIILNLYDITDNVNYPLCIIDKNDNIIYANKEFINMTNVNILNTNIYDTFKNFDNDILEFKDNFYQKQLYKSENGYKKIFFLDVSEKIKLENLRKEFSANVSHELKTPLTTILGYSEMLSLGMVKDDNIINVSKIIYNQASDLLELLENIIKISKLEAGKFEDTKENININNIFDEELEYFNRKIINNKIKINILKNEKYDIFANKTTVKEIIHNLISNAIKYNNDEKIINIKIYKNYFSIENTANNLNSEELDRIFERFYRGDKSRNKNIDGSGLGLSIVKHAVLLNNGKISVKNTNIGIKFTVKL